VEEEKERKAITENERAHSPFKTIGSMTWTFIVKRKKEVSGTPLRVTKSGQGESSPQKSNFQTKGRKEEKRLAWPHLHL